MPKLIFALVLILSFIDLHGQSCCSGGVPLSNNLGMPGASPGMVQLSLAYDYNNLNTLRTGWDRLEDNSRERLTHSILLNWSLSLSPRFSVEGILSYLQQGISKGEELKGAKVFIGYWFSWAAFYPNLTLFD